MSDVFQSLLQIPPPFNMIVLVVLIVSAAGTVSSFAKQFRKFGTHRQELEFKRDLVERGLSVDEIERVVSAKSNFTSKDTA